MQMDCQKRFPKKRADFWLVSQAKAAFAARHTTGEKKITAGEMGT